MNKEQLIAQRNARNESMKAILAGVAERGESGLSAEEATKYDGFEKEFDDLTRQIERLENQEKRENYLNEPSSKPVRSSGNDDTPSDAEEYKNAFVRMIANRATSADIQVLEQRAVQIDGDGSQGGYLVPEDFQTTILEKLDEETVLRNYATVTRTTSERSIPVGADTPTFGWIDELGTYPEVDITFGQVKIGAHKTGGIVLVSREVIADSSTNIESYVTDKMVKGLSKTESLAFMSGNGVKKPTGITTTATVGVTSLSATAILVSELTSMKYSVKRAYRKKAKWLISDAFAKAIENLVDGNGTKIWQPSIVEGTPDMLLGHPVDYDDNLGGVTAGEIPAMFGDFSYYNIGDRGDIYIQVLREKYADKGAIGILVDKRTDGKLLDTNAVKTFKMAAS